MLTECYGRDLHADGVDAVYDSGLGTRGSRSEGRCPPWGSFYRNLTVFTQGSKKNHGKL